MLSDPAKLIFLAVCMTVSLGSFLTSPSIAMSNAAMRKLAPKTRQHCSKQMKAVDQCKPNSDPDNCIGLQQAALTCEKVVKKVYQHINLGGCPYEIKAVTLCEDEWCSMSRKPADIESCRKECSVVRETLNTCIATQVSTFFRKYGL